jgi:phosphoribosylformylglycinamidine (FGAM) synthase PurS component
VTYISTILSVKLIFININIELKQQLLNSAGKSVEKAGMATPSNKVYEPFWKVAKLLLSIEGESKMVKNEKVIKLINNDDITLLLRNSNVFSYNQATNEIGFQSRAIQYYLQQQLSKMNEENEF